MVIRLGKVFICFAKIVVLAQSAAMSLPLVVIDGWHFSTSTPHSACPLILEILIEPSRSSRDLSFHQLVMRADWLVIAAQ